MGLKNFLNGLFGTAATDEMKRLKAALASAQSDLSEEVSRRTEMYNKFIKTNDKLTQANKERNIFQLQVNVLKKELESKSVKLSDTQAKKQLRDLTKAKIKQLEAQLRAAPEQLQGATMVYNKRTKKVGLVEFKSKTEALALVKKAKSGSIRFV